MVDLKNLKWDELTFVEMPKRDMNTKVRCTFRRAVPGSYRPDNSKCIITDLPKSWYDEFFQKAEAPPCCIFNATIARYIKINS